MPRNPSSSEKSPHQVKSGYTESVYDDLCELAKARLSSPGELQRRATLRMLYGSVGPAGVQRHEISWPKLGPHIRSSDLNLSQDTVRALQHQAATRGMPVLAYMGQILSLAVHGAYRRPAAQPADFSDSMMAAFRDGSEGWR